MRIQRQTQCQSCGDGSRVVAAAARWCAWGPTGGHGGSATCASLMDFLAQLFPFCCAAPEKEEPPPSLPYPAPASADRGAGLPNDFTSFSCQYKKIDA